MLAEAGADIVINSLTDTYVMGVADDIARATGRRVVPLVADVTKSGEVERAVAWILKEFGALHRGGQTEDGVMTTRALRVGAVAAGPSVATIWEGMRAYFEEAGAPIVPVLFASYEEQTEALFNRAIDIAWNGPVAYVRCAARSADCQVLAMRDVDVDCTTVMIARSDSGIAGLADLRGKRLALGDGGSRQGAILPLYYLRQAGLDTELDLTLQSYAVGKTGDLEVLRALHDGAADAGMIGRPTWDRESAHGRVDPAALRCVWQSAPYNHCNFTALADFDPCVAQRWTDALLKMDYGDPRWRPVMDLEGLTSWQPGRMDGYEELAKAIRFEDQLARSQPASDPHRSLGGHAR